MTVHTSYCKSSKSMEVDRGKDRVRRFLISTSFLQDGPYVNVSVREDRLLTVYTLSCEYSIILEGSRSKDSV